MIATQTKQDNPAAGPTMADESLIKVTLDAARKLRGMMAKEGHPDGVLRIAVMGGGCSGLSYNMDFQAGPANNDFIVDSNGIKVAVDPQSAQYLTGSEVDYAESLQESGFNIKNPNATKTCSCGDSFCA